MKALIVVLLISSLLSLAQARQGSCIAANESDITNTYQEKVTVEEGKELNCMIYYGWDAEKEECVTKKYHSWSSALRPLLCDTAIIIQDSIYCECSFTNCNADLRPFTEALEALKMMAENEETDLKKISNRQIERQLIACMLEKAKAANGESTAEGDGPTSTTEDGDYSMSTSDSPYNTEDTESLISTTPEESTSEQSTLPETINEEETTSEPPTTTETNPGESEVVDTSTETKDILSSTVKGGVEGTATTETSGESTESREDILSASSTSTFLGLFIGSAVFNVLLVLTSVALIVALVKMKNKLGEAKQGTAKVEKKIHQTPIAIQIENPVVNKDSSTVPPPASTTKAADQPEAAADTTGTSQDLDTTGGTSGSDSTGTGPDGFNEVRWSVRGFNRN